MRAVSVWFLIICGLHFLGIMICDAVMRSAIADRLGALFLWKFSFAFLRGIDYRMASGFVGLSISPMRKPPH